MKQWNISFLWLIWSFERKLYLGNVSFVELLKNWRHPKSDKGPQLHTVFLIRNLGPKTACPASQCSRYGPSSHGPPRRQLDAVVTLSCYFWRPPSGLVVQIAKWLVWPDRSTAALALPNHRISSILGEMYYSLFHRGILCTVGLKQSCAALTSPLPAQRMQHNLFRCTSALQELEVYFGASFELLGRFLTVLNVTSNGEAWTVTLLVQARANYCPVATSGSCSATDLLKSQYFIKCNYY